MLNSREWVYQMILLFLLFYEHGSSTITKLISYFINISSAKSTQYCYWKMSHIKCIWIIITKNKNNIIRCFQDPPINRAHVILETRSWVKSMINSVPILFNKKNLVVLISNGWNFEVYKNIRTWGCNSFKKYLTD